MVAPTSKAPTKVKSPNSFAHAVLKTHRYTEMVNFYCALLGGHVVYGNEFLSFVAYDEEHHRIAIIGIPDLGERNPKLDGLDHLAFSFNTLDDLMLAWEQRKEVGLLPTWCVNHGPTTSIYYRDPDGNKVETQVDNFDSVEDATAFMYSDEFNENPIGTDFDPEELISRMKSGEDVRSIKKRIECGPRGVPIHIEV